MGAIEQVLSIQNFPAGCSAIGAFAIIGAITFPTNGFFQLVFWVSIVVGSIAFILNVWIRKHEADKRAESDRLRLKSEKEKSSRNIKNAAVKQSVESMRNQREYTRKERSEINQRTTFTDNLWKMIRGT